jgi:hypothetical protein
MDAFIGVASILCSSWMLMCYRTPINTSVSAADTPAFKQNFMATLCSFTTSMTYKENYFTRQVINRTLSEINKRNSVCERMLTDSTWWVVWYIALVVIFLKNRTVYIQSRKKSVLKMYTPQWHIKGNWCWRFNVKIRLSCPHISLIAVTKMVFIMCAIKPRHRKC